GDVSETTHNYYRNDDTVRRDIVQVLKGRSDDLIDNRRWVAEKRYYTLQEIIAAPQVARRRSSRRPRRGAAERRSTARAGGG
ncbi:MAG TPA: hypothetical protein VFS03_00220, partial [Microvirga sp.]|nr:hypothetical protein [Microvirga sp.]